MEVIRNIQEALNLYEIYYTENNDKIQKLLKLLKKKYDSVLLWGAGLKGSAFLWICDSNKRMIEYVIDTDDYKKNKQLESGHVIKGIDDIKENTAIIISNVNYYSSVCFSLINAGYDIKKLHLICLDDYISEKVSLNMIETNQLWNWRRYYD